MRILHCASEDHKGDNPLPVSEFYVRRVKYNSVKEGIKYYEVVSKRCKKCDNRYIWKMHKEKLLREARGVIVGSI